jgi:hypothetical protein
MGGSEKWGGLGRQSRTTAELAALVLPSGATRRELGAGAADLEAVALRQPSGGPLALLDLLGDGLNSGHIGILDRGDELVIQRYLAGDAG